MGICVRFLRLEPEFRGFRALFRILKHKKSRHEIAGKPLRHSSLKPESTPVQKYSPSDLGFIIGIATGGMIGSIQNLAHLGYLFPDHFFYSRFHRHACGLAPLAATAQF